MEALADGEWHTSADIRERCGKLDVMGRVTALRKQGHDIESMRTVTLDASYWSWRLVVQRGEVVP